MHLISHNTCEPGDSYRKRFRSLLLCLLLCVWRLSNAIGAPFSFYLGGISLSVERSKVVGVRKDSLQKKFDNLGLGGLSSSSSSSTSFKKEF